MLLKFKNFLNLVVESWFFSFTVDRLAKKMMLVLPNVALNYLLIVVLINLLLVLMIIFVPQVVNGEARATKAAIDVVVVLKTIETIPTKEEIKVTIMDIVGKTMEMEVTRTRVVVAVGETKAMVTKDVTIEKHGIKKVIFFFCFS